MRRLPSYKDTCFGESYQESNNQSAQNNKSDMNQLSGEGWASQASTGAWQQKPEGSIQ